MSYNVDSVEIVFGDLCIEARDVKLLLLKDEHLPEATFLEVLAEAIDKMPYGAAGPLPIKRLDWSGEGSGHTWDFFLENVVPVIKGAALLVIIWEGGDSAQVARIGDGKLLSGDLYKLLAEKDVAAALIGHLR